MKQFWSHLPVFSFLLGLGGSFLLMAVAKWIGHFWLYRKEDYYD